MQAVCEKEKINWLRLSRSENIGPKTFKNLIEIYGSADQAIQKVPQMSVSGGRKKPLKILSEATATQEYEKIKKFGADIILSCEDDYPKLLKLIYDYPPILTIYGNKDILQEKSVAIVGSRNASINSKKMAYYFAKDLAKHNFPVISGLARGIDTSAHSGSLEYGTIAVIAGGIDIIYPPENKDLYKKITENGAIITEMPFGTIARAQNFPRRNRIISGISLATIVIEAALKSGSLITANYALEQSKDVFAIPGSPLDPKASGTNRLIKDGAYLIESAYDVLEVICSSNLNYFEPENSEGSQPLKPEEISDDDKNKARKIIVENLNHSPTEIDDIIALTGLPVNLTLIALLELELAGKIERKYGNKIALL